MNTLEDSGFDFDEEVADLLNAPEDNSVSDEEFVVVLNRLIENAMGGEDGEVSLVRSKFLSVYRGEKYGDERKGHSHHVTRDALEVVEWLHADILRVFASNEQVVQFSPRNPEDEEQAQLETDIANFYFADNFVTIYTWTKNALIDPTAYAYFGWENATTTRVHTLEGVPIEALAQIFNDPDVEVLEQQERQVFTGAVPMPGPNGEPPADPVATVFDLRIRQKITKGRPKIQTYPGEQVLVSPVATGLDMDEEPFSGIWEMCTVSELIEEGFDPDVVAMIASDAEEAGEDRGEERTSRHDYEDEAPNTNEEPSDDTMRRVKVYRLSVVADINGDGIAERRRVVLAGNTLLVNEEDEFQPLVAMSSIIVPHKHLGISMVELASDIQRLKTHFYRQLIDNVTSLGINRRLVNESSLTTDGRTERALKNNAAEIVYVRGDPRVAMAPDVPASQLEAISSVVAMIDERKKTQTGVAPDLHIDPAMLQRVAAEPAAQAQSAANKRGEMLIRVMAETGWRRGFGKIHYLLRTHQDQSLEIKLRGKVWVKSNPRFWDERDEVIINVGLGFPNRERRIATIASLLEIQMTKVAPMNIASPMNIYATLQKFVEALDIGDVSKFFTEPDPAKGWKPPQPPPPDPVMVAQAKVYEAQAAKFEQEEQRRMVELQIQAAKDEREATFAHEQAMAKMQVEIERMQLERWKAEQQHKQGQAKQIADIRQTEAKTELALTQAEALEKQPAKPANGPDSQGG